MLIEFLNTIETAFPTTTELTLKNKSDLSTLRLKLVSDFATPGNQVVYELDVKEDDLNNPYRVVRSIMAMTGAPVAEGTERENHVLDTPTRIRFYGTDFYVLSNFSSFQISYNGMMFPTSEHLYQYHKFSDHPELAMRVAVAASAHEAFRMAAENKELRRSDWEEISPTVMREILILKLQQHPYVCQKLVESGAAELVEDSWRDARWGWGPNRDGENRLGLLWMELRELIKTTPVELLV